MTPRPTSLYDIDLLGVVEQGVFQNTLLHNHYL